MSRRPIERLRLGLLGLTLGVGLGLAADALRRAALSTSFPVDLNFWSEDYFMTSMLRLARGAPVYGPLGEASSSIYAPGGPWLHHALLAPLGLSTSVLANRLLSQLWQLGAVALGVLAVIAIAKRSGVWPEARVTRFASAALVASALLLGVYANPVATSLHPVAWENLVLCAALLLLVDWDRRSLRIRVLAAAALPALGFLAKQPAGPAVALALAAAIALDGTTPRAMRAALVLVPFASVAATALGLHVGTGGRFTLWGITLLSAQGFEGGSKIDDALRTIALWWLPSVLAVIVFAARALRRRSDADRAWLRAALVPLAYAPAASIAFAKALGGANNVTALGFFVSIAGVAALLVLSGEQRGSLLAMIASLLLLIQVVWLYPRRHAPSAWDIENAERICSFAKARMACGEKVLLGRGTSCYADSGLLPLDRMVCIHDAWVAGRAGELDVWERISRGDYDLVLIHQSDLHRFGPKLWPILSAKYRAFYTSPNSEPADFWESGWQGYASSRMLFFEKQSAAGEHRVGDLQGECKGVPSTLQDPQKRLHE